MSHLISIAFKAFKYFLIFSLIQFLISSTFFSVKFLITNSKFNLSSFLIVLAIISRIVLSVTIFFFLYKIKLYSAISSLSIIPIIDFVIITAVFFTIFYLRTFIMADEAKRELISERYSEKGLFMEDLTQLLNVENLNYLQETVLFFIGCYAVANIVIITVFKLIVNKLKL